MSTNIMKPLGYNNSFISMIGASSNKLDTSVSQVRHVKMQALVMDHMISKHWGEIYLGRLEYEVTQDKEIFNTTIKFRELLDTMQ